MCLSELDLSLPLLHLLVYLVAHGATTLPNTVWMTHFSPLERSGTFGLMRVRLSSRDSKISHAVRALNALGVAPPIGIGIYTDRTLV